ncbi:MAG: hypothetical protein EXS38_04250 [Opitutus sp.]|nr:hypothetical protein [Opitutus sp.]
MFFSNRPANPYGVQWRLDGKRKTKSIATREKQIAFAKALAGDAKRDGLAAFRLDESAAREWRAFRAQIGADANLDEVARHWLLTGAKASVKVSDAAKDYLAAKSVEGMSAIAHSHYSKWIGRFVAEFGDREAGTITREDVAGWLATLDAAPATRAGHLARVRGLFSWLVTCGKLTVSPCAGIKAPKLVTAEVEIFTVQQGRDLFEKNKAESRELLGRLALEAFCGLRFSSAARIAGSEIKFAEKGIVLPAQKIKTERREYIDGLPENLWAWLAWSKPETWTMTPRAYLAAKSLARVRAGLPEIRNALRHSFCSYHIAQHKDPSRTSVILCHTSPRTLWKHYRGNATNADGAAWFSIVPPESSS